MEERITELEIRSMLQERTIQELNDTVYRQELVLAQLEQDLRIIKEQMQTIMPSLVVLPKDEEPPPHY